MMRSPHMDQTLSGGAGVAFISYWAKPAQETTASCNGEYDHGKLNSHVYLMPFVEEEDHYFLKTVMPSTKATREYLSTCAQLAVLATVHSRYFRHFRNYAANQCAGL